MAPTISYQFADSSLLNKKFGETTVVQDSMKIKLIEEKDESAIKVTFQPPKQKIEQVKPTEVLSNESAALSRLADTTTFGLKTELIDKFPTRKFFSTKESKVQHQKTFYNPTLKYRSSNTEIALLLSCLFIVAVVKKMNPSRFSSIIKSVYSTQTTYEIVRGEKIFFNRTNLLLNITYLIGISLFIYPFIKTSSNATTIHFELATFSIIVSLLWVFYVIKLITNIVLNTIFDTEEITLEYIYTTSLFNNVIGIMMIPILFLTYFTTLSHYIYYQKIVLLIIFIVLLVRIIRQVRIAVKKNIFILHIILYICTLEILPLIVIIKFFVV